MIECLLLMKAQNLYILEQRCNRFEISVTGPPYNNKTMISLYSVSLKIQSKITVSVHSFKMATCMKTR